MKRWSIAGFANNFICGCPPVPAGWLVNAGNGCGMFLQVGYLILLLAAGKFMCIKINT
jgi:hypothetical protein